MRRNAVGDTGMAGLPIVISSSFCRERKNAACELETIPVAADAAMKAASGEMSMKGLKVEPAEDEAMELWGYVYSNELLRGRPLATGEMSDSLLSARPCLNIAGCGRPR